MFIRVAVTKLEFLLEKGLKPDKSIDLCNEEGEVVCTIDEYGKVVWKEKEVEGT